MKYLEITLAIGFIMQMGIGHHYYTKQQRMHEEARKKQVKTMQELVKISK